jgi:molecular chaperone GrpE
MVEQHDVDDDLEMADAGATDAPVADGVPVEKAADSDPAPVEKAADSDAVRRLAEQQEKYLRLAAEYDNFRKRTSRERQEAQSRGQADLLKGMLDVLDDISRFAHVEPSATNTETVVEGVAMVEKKLLKTLGSLGLEVINPVDQAFDPTLHEAVMTEPAASPEDDHLVARVFQPGYLFNGQLLRPARVVVKQWNG